MARRMPSTPPRNGEDQGFFEVGHWDPNNQEGHSGSGSTMQQPNVNSSPYHFAPILPAGQQYSRNSIGTNFEAHSNNGGGGGGGGGDGGGIRGNVRTRKFKGYSKNLESAYRPLVGSTVSFLSLSPLGRKLIHDGRRFKTHNRKYIQKQLQGVVDGTSGNVSSPIKTYGVAKEQSDVGVMSIPRSLAYRSPKIPKDSTADKITLLKRQDYPLWQHRAMILENIRQNQFILIKSPPGSGKTTQVPQYILDEAIMNNTPVRIISVNPWRPSVPSAAAWVAYERGEIIGQTVGYQTQLDSLYSPTDTILTFCSPCILLRSINCPNHLLLNNSTHIILDEVHDRNATLDVLMGALRNYIYDFPHLKVIIMSSSLDVGFFLEYFSDDAKCGVLDVKDVQSHYGKTLFLNEMIELTKYGMSDGSPITTTEYLNYNLILHTLQTVHNDSFYPPNQSILVFLPGYEEIIILLGLIAENEKLGGSIVLIFHGGTASEEINLNANKPNRSQLGKRLILLATHVAETSVTCDDIFLVIDSGLNELSRNDLEPILPFKRYEWITKEGAAQRQGRISRGVHHGWIFRMYTREQFNTFKESKVPEILRISLEDTLLRISPLLADIPLDQDFREMLMEFLLTCPTPPRKDRVYRAVDSLICLGGFSKTSRISSLGSLLLDIPLEPAHSKILIYSAIFKCLDPILTIVAFMIHGDPFMKPNDLGESSSRIKSQKRLFAQNSFSDHVANVIAFQTWEKMRADGQEMEFCKRNNLRSTAFEKTYAIRTQALAYLRSVGLVRHSGAGNVDDLNRNSKNWPMVRAVIVAGLHQNLAYINKDKCELELKDKGKMFISPESVNSPSDPREVKEWPFDWLIFDEQEDILTNSGTTTFIKGISFVSPITVALFGADFYDDTPKRAQIKRDEILLSYSNGKQIIFQKEDIPAFLEFRQNIQDLFLRRVTYQNTVNTHQENKLVTCLAELLFAEECAIGISQIQDFGTTPIFTAGNMLSVPSTGFEHSKPKYVAIDKPRLNYNLDNQEHLAEYFRKAFY